jgi:hypothetical protein
VLASLADRAFQLDTLTRRNDQPAPHSVALEVYDVATHFPVFR